MRACLLVLVLAACGSHGGSGDDADDDVPPPDAGVPPEGSVTLDLHVDNAGWRTADRKIAVVVGHDGATVELIDDAGRTAGTYTAEAAGTDEDSGDLYATVDFSEITAPGTYYLYLRDLDLRSYTFVIDDAAFDDVGHAAMKSFYFQRCNHDKDAAHAGAWTDAACHLTDDAAPAGPGSPDHGALDVHGGWHDAGDYQKTLWGRGVPEMLFAAELNGGGFGDGSLDLPESGNGTADIVDELRWELDFYVRMQRPDGHFMTSVKGRDPTVVSPPSASDEGRVYFDVTSPNSDGWSGGGVTIATATGNAVLSLAHAAIVTGDAAYATAARSGWTWLAAQTLGDNGERRLRAAAAAAVYRMDPTIATAQAIVEGFNWATWDDQLGGATPGEGVIAAGAWHVLANDAASATVKNAVKTGVAAVIVDGAFGEAGAYGGMFGGPGNGWDWSWGSNRNQSMYGANLMMAAHFGVLGGHSEADVVALAEQHLHDLLGLNPLGMVYLTNLAGIGVEHSSFHLYHSWFSYTGADGDHGNADFDGKPADVDEPLYPYYPDDSSTSTSGPAPGLLVGGPNFYYSGAYTIPGREYPARAYRDFSVGCDWDGAQCRASSWELTEPDDGYQGPFILLISFFM
jgi:endoglucanase